MSTAEKLLAIKYMHDNNRYILNLQKAHEIGSAFGLTIEDLPIRNYTILDYNSQDRAEIWKEGNGVSVYLLAIAIVKKIGKTPVTDCHFLGMGRTSEFLTEENLKILEAGLDK